MKNSHRHSADGFNVAGGADLPSHLVGDSDASFDAPTDPIGRRLATLLHLYPDVKSNFRQVDLATMDSVTKQTLLDDLLCVLGIPTAQSTPL